MKTTTTAPRRRPAAVAAPPVAGSPVLKDQTPPRRLTVADALAALGAPPEPVRAAKVAKVARQRWQPSPDLADALAAAGWEVSSRYGVGSPAAITPEELAAPVPTDGSTPATATLLWLAHGAGGALPSMAAGETLPVAVLALAADRYRERIGGGADSLSGFLKALATASRRVVVRNGEDCRMIATVPQSRRGKPNQSRLSDLWENGKA